MKVLGTFGKGVANSVSINFSRSGGRNCDKGCRLHPESEREDRVDGTPCYMVRLEKLYPSVNRQLGKREQLPAWKICGMGLVELQSRKRKGEHIPWVRFSVAGSLPQPADVRDDYLFRQNFRALLAWCRNEGIPVHIPVETYAKARFYRALAGDLAVIRESAQTVKRFLRAKGPVSVYCGEHLPRKARVAFARLIAAARRLRTGRKQIVCPAITHSWAVRYDGLPRNPMAKCGACTACANPSVDIIYPKH